MWMIAARFGSQEFFKNVERAMRKLGDYAAHCWYKACNGCQLVRFLKDAPAVQMRQLQKQLNLTWFKRIEMQGASTAI